MKTTEETTLTEMLEKNERLVTWPPYGRVLTLNVKQLAAKLVQVLARHCSFALGGGFVLTYHTVPSMLQPAPKSIFGAQTGHHILEMNGVVPDESLAGERVKWAAQVKADLEAGILRTS
ncbi:hypothetical protein FOXG_17609 [Fusarium oxysporum f. sp. lycopersici 4287]|uniref:Uncharacterized protein n=3 Tax=Fusarium oxysporum TaxID=5507 RepID=A0A0J9WDC6_FUSO4|nr:uncharacterized protein FOXG_17609 [Fusarium oxysporum f. sp. lycopersici 4287]EXK26355.1 hypothetical protein FOMG_17030 [Fusarium oxysporum f. sp. melonis 26406]KAJ9413994.1 hypothetical protein QL093DRAFT_2106429 [Fusarium oxysporum]KNB20640.1 hypothetical protein FOXG_17609 [Fusarium oxysporum f. sp. lycopersici 4287]